jgi:hypothetical protein
VVAGLTAFGSATVSEALPPGTSGPVAGAIILVVGFVALLVYGGLLYLGLGIYHNTRRTAELLEMRGGRAEPWEAGWTRRPPRPKRPQQVFTLLVEVGRKAEDGLPAGRHGAALMCYAAGRGRGRGGARDGGRAQGGGPRARWTCRATARWRSGWPRATTSPTRSAR